MAAVQQIYSGSELDALFPSPSSPPNVLSPPRYPGVSPEAVVALAYVLKENYTKYHIFFNYKRFHNHITHRALALFVTGASGSLIEEFYKQDSTYQRPAVESPEAVTEENFIEHLEPVRQRDVDRGLANVSCYRYAIHIVLDLCPTAMSVQSRLPPYVPQRPETRRRLVQYSILLVSILISATANILESVYAKDPEPYHTSALSGEAWVMELLSGHPERIRCELGVHAHVFAELISEIRALGHTASKFVSLEEQLAIFLYTSVTGLSLRHVGERFQRSNDTISRYFRKMLNIFSSSPFYTKYVQLPDASVPNKIRHNPKFWPFFKDTIGAIDGSHIHASPRAFERGPYRNRKGFVSQNCLFACDFNLNFIYALTGWEGSATDARIYEAAEGHDLRIPVGKYFLADAGFPLRPELLIPYRNVRYHLAEWGRASVRPTTKQELFNLRHASARNVIERIFGVLKRRFRILLLSPPYAMGVQAQIPAALCSVHNFIRLHDPAEGNLPDADHPIGDAHTANWEQEPAENHPARHDDVHLMRDRIAEAMWVDYQRILQERGDDNDDLSEGIAEEDEDGLD